MTKFMERVKERMNLLIITALGLFLALQYNVVVSELLAPIFPADAIFWKIIYLVFLTILIVIIIVIVERAFGRR